MIHHLHFIGWKIIALTAWGLSFTGLAVTEAFLGQMAIALVVALIGAAPPTIAIILMARTQSRERSLAQEVLLQGQKKMAEDLDGKLDRLSKAETGQAKAEGIIEGGEKEQARVAAVVPTASPLPADIGIVNKKTEAVPTIPGTEEPDLPRATGGK